MVDNSKKTYYLIKHLVNVTMQNCSVLNENWTNYFMNQEWTVYYTRITIVWHIDKANLDNVNTASVISSSWISKIEEARVDWLTDTPDNSQHITIGVIFLNTNLCPDIYGSCDIMLFNWKPRLFINMMIRMAFLWMTMFLVE